MNGMSEDETFNEEKIAWNELKKKKKKDITWSVFERPLTCTKITIQMN